MSKDLEISFFPFGLRLGGDETRVTKRALVGALSEAVLSREGGFNCPGLGNCQMEVGVVALREALTEDKVLSEEIHNAGAKTANSSMTILFKRSHSSGNEATTS